MNGDYKGAQNMLGQMNPTTADDQLFASLAQTALALYGNGQNWFNIDAQTAAQLSTQGQYDLAAGYAAGQIDALVGAGPVSLPLTLMADTAFEDSIAAYRNGNPNGNRNGNAPSGATGNDAVPFRVYPNPSNGQMTVEASVAGIFEVCNITGQIVGQYAVANGATNIGLPPNLPAGVYLGRFRPEGGGMANIVKLMVKP